MNNTINNLIEKHIETIKKLRDSKSTIEKIALLFIAALKNGNKIIFFGNGGSAADAQHLSAELVGRFKKKKRRPLASIALNTNTSIITAVGNDFGFKDIFSHQIDALAKKGDIAVGISTSGSSENVVSAILKAKENGITTVGFLGRDGGQLINYVDIPLLVNSNDTARIQETHILAGHIICEIVDNEIF